jgi:hypothetical protein
MKPIRLSFAGIDRMFAQRLLARQLLTGLRGTVLSADARGWCSTARSTGQQRRRRPGAAARGCDHAIATCNARFGNAANFRANLLPGNDLLAQYPMP